MKKPIILRKRYLPDETVDISGDALLKRTHDLLITQWLPIRPRTDFAGGVSYTFLEQGYKISRFEDANGQLLYWYCDIIEVDYDEQKDQYTLKDLLVDMKVMPSGEIRVLDTDELATTLRAGIITTEQACKALETLHQLLEMAYSGNFPPTVCTDALPANE